MKRKTRNAYGGPAKKHLHPIPSNLPKLKGRMREYNITIEKAAAILGHSMNYVRARLEGDYAFDVVEAITLGRLLEMSTDEIRDIFLGQSTNFEQRRGA